MKVTMVLFVTPLVYLSLFVCPRVWAWAPLRPHRTLLRHGTICRRSEANDQKADHQKDFDLRQYLQSFSLAPVFDNADRIRQNTWQGGGGTTLGQRGEVYVAAQAAVMLGIAVGTFPLFIDVMHYVVGPILLLVGSAVLVASVTDLGAALSPWPTPVEDNDEGLVTTGLYSQVRHPIYGGLLTACTGLALVTASLDRLLLTALLYGIFTLKTAVEEQALVQRFPDDYPAYRQQVPDAFVPWTAVQRQLAASKSKSEP